MGLAVWITFTQVQQEIVKPPETQEITSQEAERKKKKEKKHRTISHRKHPILIQHSNGLSLGTITPASNSSYVIVSCHITFHFSISLICISQSCELLYRHQQFRIKQVKPVHYQIWQLAILILTKQYIKRYDILITFLHSLLFCCLSSANSKDKIHVTDQRLRKNCSLQFNPSLAQLAFKYNCKLTLTKGISCFLAKQAELNIPLLWQNIVIQVT